MAGDIETTRPAPDEAPPPADLRSRLRDLYFGGDRRATRFQLAMLAFDLVTVTFFVVTTFMPVMGWILVADLFIAAGLFLEFAARLYISPRPLQYLRQPMAIVDLVVLASLLLPTFGLNLGFLRILRAVRLVRSYTVLNALEAEVPFVQRNRRVLRAGLISPSSCSSSVPSSSSSSAT